MDKDILMKLLSSNSIEDRIIALNFIRNFSFTRIRKTLECSTANRGKSLYLLLPNLGQDIEDRDFRLRTGLYVHVYSRSIYFHNYPAATKYEDL